MKNLFRKEIDDKLKNVVFIELKEEYKIGDTVLPIGFSLPIKLDYLIEGINKKELEEEINIVKIVEAIIYLLGIDKDFKYKIKYIEILKKLKIDIKKFAMHKAYINQEIDLLDSYLFLQGYENIFGEDAEILFKQGNILEGIYNKNVEEDIELSDKILNIIIKKYNRVLDLDEEFDLAYYRLAYINLSLSKYIKANLYFEKFMNYSKDEVLKEETRDEIESIKDNVNYDSAKTYLSYGEYNKALNLLKDISDNFDKDAEYYYMAAIIYYNMGDNFNAMEYAKESIEKEVLEESVNLLSTIYAQEQNFSEAIEVLRKGLDELNNSYPLNYNLGIIYLNTNEKELGKEYLEKALNIKPNEELEKVIENLK